MSYLSNWRRILKFLYLLIFIFHPTFCLRRADSLIFHKTELIRDSVMLMRNPNELPEPITKDYSLLLFRFFNPVLDVFGKFLILSSSFHKVSVAATETSEDHSNNTLFPWAIDVIKQGNIYIHDNWISKEDSESLRQEISRRFNEGEFTRSGLTNSKLGKQQNFGTTDRSVSPLNLKDIADMSSNDQDAQNALRRFALKLSKLQLQLSKDLHRPSLIDENLDHECYFSAYPEGSSLKRHLDEKHEEVKGVKGWLSPSRRSITWLLYLSENWDESNGGALRAYPQNNLLPDYSLTSSSVHNHISKSLQTGSHEGNLQVGWLLPNNLRISSKEHREENSEESFQSVASQPSVPVYLDSWMKNQIHSDTNYCLSSLYVLENQIKHKNLKFMSSSKSTPRRRYITRTFDVNERQTEIMNSNKEDNTNNNNNNNNDNRDLQSEINRNGYNSKRSPAWFLTESDFFDSEDARRFVLIEDQEAWAAGKEPFGSRRVDIYPIGSRLILFDSVTIPHEVLPILKGQRFALAGWFHEKHCMPL